MARRNRNDEQVTEARRRGGRLWELATSRGRRFLVVKDSRTEPFLEVGAELGKEDLEWLETAGARSAGIAIACRLLSHRDRTVQEVRSALCDAGISSQAVIDEVVDSLKTRGYLDDRRFAAGYVRYMIEHRPSGPVFLRHRLGRVGVDEKTIDEIVRSEFPPGKERELALGLVRRRLRAGVDRRREARRINGFLARRGFGSDVAGEVCARILRGELSGEGDE